MRPAGKKLARVGKPGPYETIEDAIEGLKSPNLATQFLARYLLGVGQRGVAALAALLTAEDPNYRARALWVLDRLGGAARDRVAGELKNPSGRERALAVRILRRHAEDYCAAILPLADDTDVEVRREVLLALRGWRGADVDAALLKLAGSYDGADRYLLEAIHIAAGDRAKPLAAQLAATGRVSFDNVDLIQALDPDAAVRFVTAALGRPDVGAAGRARLLARLGTMASLEAANVVLATALDRAADASSRQAALATVARNLSGDWQALAERPELTSGVAQLLTEADLRATVIELIEKQNLRRFGGMLLVVVHSADLPIEDRAKALAAAAKLGTDGAIPTCETLVASREQQLRTTAARALVDLQAWPAVKRLLVSPTVSPGLKKLVVERASDSAGGAWCCCD